MKHISVQGIEKEMKLSKRQAYGKNYILDEEYEVTVIINEQKHNIIIPKGFKTDLASVPRLFWYTFPPEGTTSDKYSNPAVLHDYLYSEKYFTRKDFIHYNITVCRGSIRRFHYEK